MAKLTREQIERMTDDELAAHYGVGVDEANMIAALALGEGGDVIRLERAPEPEVDPQVAKRLGLKRPEKAE
jgi:hypothetical protein